MIRSVKETIVHTTGMDSLIKGKASIPDLFQPRIKPFQSHIPEFQNLKEQDF